MFEVGLLGIRGPATDSSSKERESMKGARVYPVFCGYHFSVCLSLEDFPREKSILHKLEGAWESIRKHNCVCVCVCHKKELLKIWVEIKPIWVG